jgi:UDP-N-acetylglucosamine 2-epimerase (non-hydrolysing)
MTQSYLVLTDSGGIQEEAPGLGKPVLVMRDVTERPEGVWAGTVKLVGTSREKIFRAAQELLDNPDCYQAMAQAKNPYGDGRAAEKIMAILNHHLEVKQG